MVPAAEWKRLHLWCRGSLGVLEFSYLRRLTPAARFVYREGLAPCWEEQALLPGASLIQTEDPGVLWVGIREAQVVLASTVQVPLEGASSPHLPECHQETSSAPLLGNAAMRLAGSYGKFLQVADVGTISMSDLSCSWHSP